MSEAQVPISAAAAAMRLLRELGARRQRQLGLTLVLMVVGALAETATIGAVLPFLAIVAPGDGGAGYAWVVAPVHALATLLGLTDVATAAVMLVAIATCAAVIRLALLWIGQHYVYAIAHDLSLGVYARILYRPYARHVIHNSAETLAAMEKVQFVLGNVLLPAMAGLTALIVALFILLALIAIDATTALMAAACFGTLYALVSRFTRRRLYSNSDVVSGALKDRIQALQEGLGGIRDVLLDRSQDVFLNKFARIDDRFRVAQATNQFIAAAPRFAVEAAGVVLIAVIAVFVSGRPGGLPAALPMLGAMAVGAQRLLPLIQQTYFSSAQIFGHRAALVDVATLMSEPLPAETGAIEPRHAALGPVVFRGVGFSYPGGRGEALSGIDLIIAPGARIGLVGPSGSGKSTFVDLLMGLLDPSEGDLLIDGARPDSAVKAAWQAGVAHVPQAIFLADGSIAENIAFGRSHHQIDMERVREAARQAEIDQFVGSLPEGYDTFVGERGVRLSGGQRQRIGIARALYKRANVLVLDEATSALDEATEAAVMHSVAQLPRELTLIIVAHRLSTLQLCEEIVRLDAGRIAARGSYAEMIGQARARG